MNHSYIDNMDESQKHNVGKEKSQRICILRLYYTGFKTDSNNGMVFRDACKL